MESKQEVESEEPESEASLKEDEGRDHCLVQLVQCLCLTLMQLTIWQCVSYWVLLPSLIKYHSFILKVM